MSPHTTWPSINGGSGIATATLTANRLIIGSGGSLSVTGTSTWLAPTAATDRAAFDLTALGPSNDGQFNFAQHGHADVQSLRA